MSYEARRLENVQRNQALVKDLGLENNIAARDDDGLTKRAALPPSKPMGRVAKRRKLQQASQPTRTSARIANAPTRPLYNEDAASSATPEVGNKRQKQRPAKKVGEKTIVKPASPPKLTTPPPSYPDLESLAAGWYSWEPTAPPPTRDEEGTYHFASHPAFTPNKSPEAIIREGSFGGSYWRPLRSRALRATVADDWRELPGAWTAGLSVPRYLTSAAYRPAVNRYGVACGQSIEEWEAAGWIAHAHDVRGWFQWYCRFWLGRRCPDDERQVGRWRRCVGEAGRFRRLLLAKYVRSGIRSVADEGGDEDSECTKVDLSPVVHQTCLHWAWEVRQEALDRFWEDGR